MPRPVSAWMNVTEMLKCFLMAGLRISLSTSYDCMGAFDFVAAVLLLSIYIIIETGTFYLPREMQRKEKTVHELRTRDAVVNPYIRRIYIYTCLQQRRHEMRSYNVHEKIMI